MRRWAAAGVAVAIALGACSSDDSANPDATSTTVSAAAPDEWPTAGFDLSNSRAVRGGAIATPTVDDLAPTWTADLGDLGSLSTVPIVAGGSVYLQGSSGAVVALDAATGKERWRSAASGFNIGPFGVAVDDDRVYALDGSSGVLALDRASGQKLWATDVTATDTTGIDIQPVVVGDLVIVSSVPISIQGIYKGGDRGVVTALDRATGTVRWTFDTVKGADLWGDPAVNSGGGAWYPPAVDEQAGVVYVGVANPAPFPGTADHPNGSSRPGDNLYTDSLVALDLATGALRWYHQVTSHDIFDRDQVHAQIVDLGDDGSVIVSSGKSGVLVGLEPKDGTVRWETEVGDHEHDDLTALDGPTKVAPGTYGGVLTPPAAADGIVYAAVINAPVELEPDQEAYFGAQLGAQHGEVVAVDAATGKQRWSTEVDGDPLGAATVVNDLVLTTLVDGTLVVLDRATGKQLRTIPLGGSTNGWMAAAGDHLYIPVTDESGAKLMAFGV